MPAECRDSAGLGDALASLKGNCKVIQIAGQPQASQPVPRSSCLEFFWALSVKKKSSVKNFVPARNGHLKSGLGTPDTVSERSVLEGRLRQPSSFACRGNGPHFPRGEPSRRHHHHRAEDALLGVRGLTPQCCRGQRNRAREPFHPRVSWIPRPKKAKAGYSDACFGRSPHTAAGCRHRAPAGHPVLHTHRQSGQPVAQAW